MKASEVTEPGYYWVRHQEPGLSPHWYIVEMDLGQFYECGNEVAIDEIDGDLYGPVTPPIGKAFIDRRGGR